MGQKEADTLSWALILSSFPPSLIYPFRQPEKHITLQDALLKVLVKEKGEQDSSL